MAKSTGSPRSFVRDAPVEVIPYNEAWPAMFDAERAVLEAALEPWLVGPVEHIGSTAVVGLPAKPVIDIMAPVLTLEAASPAIAAAENVGYVHAPYKADVMHWFCKPSPAHRTHHLHLVPCGSDLWRERLAFRNALREDPALAGRYGRLKLELAARFRHDREAYTHAKGAFVQEVLTACSRRSDGAP